MGKNFVVTEHRILVFDQVGYQRGNYWIVSSELLHGHQFPSVVELMPQPAFSEVMEVLHNCYQAQRIEQIAHITVSSRIAIRLFLDGTLKPSNFNFANEEETEYLPWRARKVPVIKLPKVSLGGWHFPLHIMRETLFDYLSEKTPIFAIDQDFHDVLIDEN